MDYARMVFISANVETLVEQPELISDWSTAVAKEITEQKPSFAAIHLQGLKTKGRGTDTAEHLIKDLDGQADMDMFETSRTFYDLENLGLCSVYYVKNEARAALFDNKRQEYWSVEGRQNDPPGSAHLHKERLGNGYNLASSQEPASFMMSRWLLFNNKPFTFINLSLTPDQSVLDGCLTWPSKGGQERKDEFQSLIDGLNLFDEDAILLSGNYGCTLNKEKLLKDQAYHHNASVADDTDADGNLCKYDAIELEGRVGDVERVFFANGLLMFDFGDLHDWLFGTCNGQLIKKYDQELQQFKAGPLREANLYFGPTCYYDWDREKEADCFSRSDCPGWKNRILMNKQTWEMMHHDSFSSSGMYYGLIGKGINIGAHKPVSLIATVCVK